jgi:co-chaperonin GroES (HSP10)
MTQGNLLPTKVLVKPRKKEEKTTQGGIIIPNAIVKDINITAEVVLLGNEIPKEIVLKEGDIVLFNPHAPQRLVIEDVEYGLIDYRDILFFYTPEPKLL